MPPGTVTAGPYGTLGNGSIVYTNAPAFGQWQAGGVHPPQYFNLPGAPALHAESVTPCIEFLVTTTTGNRWGAYNIWFNDLVRFDPAPVSPIRYAAFFGGGAAKSAIIADDANIIFLCGGIVHSVTPTPGGGFVGVGPTPGNGIGVTFTYGNGAVNVNLLATFGLFAVWFANTPAAVLGPAGAPPPSCKPSAARPGFGIASGYLPPGTEIGIGGTRNVPQVPTTSIRALIALTGLLVAAGLALMIRWRRSRSAASC